MGDPHAVAALLEDLNQKNIHIAKTAQKGLIAMGEQVIPDLLNALESKEIRQVAGVVKVLGQIGGETALKSIMNLRDHPERLVRMNIASAAADIGGREAADFLIRWAGESQDNFDRYWIVNVLGKFDNEEVVGTLISIVGKTDSSTIRYMAIRVLGEIGAVEAIEVIRPFLDDEDHHVREDAEIALEKLNNILGEKNSDKT